MRAPTHPGRNRPAFHPTAERLESRTLLSAGSLDPTFDGDGVVLTPFHANVALLGELRKVAVLPNGRIVAAGDTAYGEPYFATVARYHADGSPDLSFGTGGKVTTPGFVNVNTLLTSPDGSVVVIGSGADFSPIIARYDANGAPDVTFDGDGILRPLPSRGGAIGALLPDGRMIIGGSIGRGLPAEASDLYITRLNRDGTIDPTFGDPDDGVAGMTVLDLGVFDGMTGIAVTDDQKIVLLNHVSGGGAFCTRLTSDGTPDATFGGGDGVVSTGVFRPQDVFSHLELRNDKILMAGFVYDSSAQQGYNVIARYLDDGSPDLTFDGDGRLLLPYDQERVGDLGIISGGGLTTDETGDVLLAGRVITSVSPAGGGEGAAGVWRFRNDGSPDADFGDGGRASVRLQGRNSLATGVAVTFDGRIVIVGVSSNPDLYPYEPKASVARITADGRLDPTFGGIGEVVASFAARAASTRASADAALQLVNADLVLATSYDLSTGNTGSDAGAIRFKPGGSTDRSFGSGGTAVVDATRDRSEHAVDVRRLADGRVLLLTTNSLFRLTGTGQLDTSFGVGGRLRITQPSGGGVIAARMALHADGSITVGGFLVSGWQPSDRTTGFLARLSANGRFDTTFAGGFITFSDGVNTQVTDLFPMENGGVLVASRELFGAQRGNLRRYTRDGRLDTTFGPEGTGRVAVGDRATRAALQPDGRIVTVGSPGTTGALVNVAVRRWNADGSVDTTFGEGGRLVLDVGQVEAPKGVTVQTDGAIIVGGDDGTLDRNGARVTDRFFLVRVTPDGRPDAAFGDGGVVRTPLPGLVRMAGLLLQSDGKVVAYGTADGKVAAVRYLTAARGAASFRPAVRSGFRPAPAGVATALRGPSGSSVIVSILQAGRDGRFARRAVGTAAGS